MPGFKHGKCRTPEYGAWRGIRMRCQWPAFRQFADYGGRGIRVCPQWESFETFLADMGPRPSPEHSIERRDNSGNYEPNNCYWATRLDQMNNTRGNRYVTLDGERMTVAQAVRKSKTPLSYRRVSRRITAGWDIVNALTRPISKGNRL